MKILQLFCIIFLTMCCTESSGLLRENFDTLFQSTHKMLEAKLEIIRNYTIEEQQYGLAYAYDVFIDQLTILIAKGTNRLTGINSNYFIEVLEGRNPPPFQSSLSCVRDGLTELQKSIFESRKLAKFMKSCCKASILTLKTCDDVSNAIAPHYNKILEGLGPFTMGYKKYVKSFESLNMLDLFTDFWTTKTRHDIKAIGIITANVLHSDQQEAIDYVNGLNNNPSFPLSCAKDTIDKFLIQMKYIYNSVLE